MSKHIKRCPDCRKYTMKDTCSSCNIATINTWPPKYSPDDRYESYRRRAKEGQRKEQGLI
jgi:H/ACA ribonucleoprotein complex subunit 3